MTAEDKFKGVYPQNVQEVLNSQKEKIKRPRC
jgi:hypothetical protein